MGSCDRCQTPGALTFARDDEASQYKWLCWNCQIASSGRWTAASLSNIDRQQAEILSHDQEERLSSGKVRLSQPRAGGPVLVVEDNESTREIICNILDGEGFPTATAANGKEALTLLRKLDPLPRMILLDLAMPAMNGFEFYDVISRDRKLSEIPVVVMTAHESARIGSLTVLHKPVSLEALLASISESCSA